MKSGGFQSMNLSKPVIQGIYRKGYKIPTPIQRKTIPIILEGRDVISMARTGSGKTAAFLVPIIEKLKAHKAQKGARALILSPTRELALQTCKFAREFAKFTDLKCEAILGGDSMERQFAKIHENPDILIATPGRLLHLAIEMDMKFSSVEMVVFDEADRLFELGFKEQLGEILARLPRNRQTLLFSATLPQMIVDFTKAGLDNPQLIRLDTENKISENLKTTYLSCRNEDKLAVLIYLLKYIIQPKEQTVVFLPTRHHIEYVKDVLSHLSIEATYLYSSLDPEARKINIRNFQSKQVRVLLVTDLAARGVDIPLLDNVINYNFPAKPKLFVHRVGRTARAGRSGTAYSLVANDETPYLFSLNLFLNKPFQVAPPVCTSLDGEALPDGVLGSVPQMVIDEENERIEKLHEQVSELDSMKQVYTSAYKQYLKTRETPDSESVRKVKLLVASEMGHHPIFWQSVVSSAEGGTETRIDLGAENVRNAMLTSIKAYKPNTTIFELGKTKGSQGFEVMKQKRRLTNKIFNKPKPAITSHVTEIFDSTVGKFKDNDFYLNYRAGNFHSEKGLQLEKSFDSELRDMVLDLDGDESGKINKNKNQLKWDRKKKKYIQQGSDQPKIKKIKTESGNWINASYKSGLYEKWMQKSKFGHQNEPDEEANGDTAHQRRNRDRQIEANMKKNKTQIKPKRPPKRELKTNDEILKERNRLEKIQSYQKKKTAERQRRHAKGKPATKGKKR